MVTILQCTFLCLSGMFTVTPLAAMQAAPASASPSEAKLAAIAGATCPSGLEHFLPGTYYYCVGRKALAGKKYDRAREMFKIAAAWGSKQAQFVLGLGYFKGDTGARNRPLGLAWLTLAAERRTPLFVALQRSAWAHASAGEQARAQQLLAAMKPRYADAHAAHRAYRRYQEFRRQLAAAEPYGGQFCIAGLTSLSVATVGAETLSPGACAGQQSASAVARQVDGYAQVLFDGWQGRVTVGGIEPAPAASGK